MTPGKLVAGTLVTQAWSYAGRSTGRDYSTFLVQPFVNYNLPHEWAVSTAPQITANWMATQSKWAVPLGGGISKTFKTGDQLNQLGVYYYTFVTRPLSSPQTQLRVVWSLLWPVKRGIDIRQLLEQAK